MLLSAISRPPRRLLNFILPRACIGCGLPQPDEQADGLCDEGLCAGCLGNLPGLRVPRCSRCALARPLAGNLQTVHADCPACAAHHFAFDASLALCDYAHPIDSMIQALKFQRRWSLGQALGASLAQNLGMPLLERLDALLAGGPRPPPFTRPLPPFTRPLPSSTYLPPSLPPTLTLCPVPLSAERLIERGFNQAALLAACVARTLKRQQRAQGWQVRIAPLLKRQRHTMAQTLVAPAERARNVGQAFVCSVASAPAIVVVIDDVMTTGATLNNAAQTLKAAGSTLVINLILARA